MSKELVIGSNRHETKVAILEEDQLVEVYFQRANEYSLAGSIHKGRVTRVLPGMQSAFVDLGLERDTFLYVSDFFEEHEDIDTVVDEKPAARSERPERDRGASRGGERSVSDRPPQERAFAPRERIAEPRKPVLVLPTPILIQPLVGDDEASAAATEEVTVSPEISAEARPGERPENRDLRGGDRRNRRSRRRRQGGRGFPENKYAQSPGSAPAAGGAVEPVLLSEEEEDSADVIMLPGESLAKYRNAAAAPESAEAERAEPRRHLSPAEPDDILPETPIDPGEQQAIEDEAEELEFSEKVFAHHDDESIEDVEEKIEEVKQDQPSSSSSLNGIGESRESASAELAHAERGHTGPASGPAEQTRVEGPLPEIPVSEVRTSFSHDSETRPFSDLAETNAIRDEETDIFEAEESGGLPESVLANPEEEAAPGENATQAQTASVREQGGRYMHRASRRMRRRRGGNRSGQGPETVSDAPAGITLPVFAAAAVTAGAAAALETEAVRKEAYEERPVERQDRPMPSIADLLKAGQEIIVQIAKEPLGQKGARITSHIALPGRYVVFMPSVTHLGVSRKIESDEERQRLKRILQTHRAGTTGGFIVRTAGEGIPEEEIAADMSFLYTLWLDIRQKAEKKPAPALLHYDLDIVQRILRDQVTDEYKAIWVDNEEMYESVLTFIQRFQPALVGRVKMYTRAAPIFDAFSITQELEKALRPKVWLKSGGYIVINQTEALVAIDINTGKYVGKSNRLEDTIVKTNTEAVKEIVRQIRLRDLGGIIVVDFIDMDERKNRQKVMQALEEAMQVDKAPYKILQFNDFGLVAITRKRVKQSLERTLCSPCPYCEAAGYVKSVQTIIGEILIEAQKIARAIEGKDVMLRAHPDVAKVLKASDNRYLEELEEVLGRPVLVTGDPTLHHEKFDLA